MENEKCPHYKRGKREDTCLKTGKRMDKASSTICRKNYKKCRLMIEERGEDITLGDFYTRR